jgi:hypothetical protein
MFQVHKLALQSGADVKSSTVDFDTVAVKVHVVEPSEYEPGEFIIYVTDETNLVLQVHCKSLPYSLRVIFAEKKEYPVIAMCDLRLCSFDDVQQCAVAEFGDLSSVMTANKRIEDLTRWVSLSSKTELPQIAFYVNANLPMWEQSCGDETTAFGYIVRLRSLRARKLLVEVDCCGFERNEWELPLEVLDSMLPTIIAENQSVGLSPREDDRARKLGTLGNIFRARGILWKFQLTPTNSSTNECTLVVSCANKATERDLGRLYLTSKLE